MVHQKLIQWQIQQFKDWDAAAFPVFSMLLGSGFPWRRGLGMHLLKMKTRHRLLPYNKQKLALGVQSPPHSSEVKALSKSIMLYIFILCQISNKNCGKLAIILL